MLAVPGQANPPEATAGGGGQQPKPFPYEDGVDAAQQLIHKVPTDELNKMLDMLTSTENVRPYLPVDPPA